MLQGPQKPAQPFVGRNVRYTPRPAFAAEKVLLPPGSDRNPLTTCAAPFRGVSVAPRLLEP